MVAIVFSEPAVANVKRALRDSFSDEKSSHLTEALAAALGFRSHAALLAALRWTSPQDPDIVLLDDKAFMRRLTELTDCRFEFEDEDCFDSLHYPLSDGVIKTWSPRYAEIEYRSKRQKAWRNLMVVAINAGIEQRLFTVRADDNRWPGAIPDRHQRSTQHVYRFEVDDIPAIAAVSDIGFAELSIHAALWPTPSAEMHIRGSWISSAGESRFSAGNACAQGWLERKEGAWLMSPEAGVDLACRNAVLDRVAGLQAKPKGFADRGNFEM